MVTLNASVERNPICHVRTIKRPWRLQLLTLFFTFLQPVTLALLSNLKEQPIKAATKKHPPTPSSISPYPKPRFDDIFMDALAKACSCRQRIRPGLAQAIASNPGYSYHKARRRKADGAERQMRHLHCTATPSYPHAQLRPLSHDDYLCMLDYYRESYSTQASATAELPAPTRMFSALRKENATIQPLEVHTGIGEPQSPLYKHKTQIAGSYSPSLAHLLDVLRRDDCTHEEAFRAYSALPSPGVSYLSRGMRLVLFRRLSIMEKKTRIAKLQYLSVVDDMKSAGLSMSSPEWNSAIAFCGQCFTHIAAVDVNDALGTWKEMERVANVRGGSVTFNILFDMATKAGKFVLAEMILKEMDDRKLKYTRFSRNAFIFYHGLRGDGDGVRRAYREFVEAGEIVDTVVLNCVILSLIRAGEPAAAEQVYERMKRMYTKQTGYPLQQDNWRKVRDLGILLDRAAQRFRGDPEKLRLLQEKQSIAPNIRTYAHMIEYHASETGELRRIAALLAEMQQLGIPMHGRLFTKLFKGFTYHGGERYTSWTKERLELVWEWMLGVVDQKLDGVRVMKWMVVWALRAFERCAGRRRMLEIWSELRRRWKPGSGDMEFVMTILHHKLQVSIQLCPNT